MAAERDRKLENLTLGDLPASLLEKAGLNLPVRPVRFTIAAQKHAISSHPREFDICLPHLHEIVAAPTYVGQGPEHKNKGFELVLSVKKGRLLILLALHIKPVAGAYIVKSIYPIERNKLERRLRKGFLVEV